MGLGNEWRLGPRRQAQPREVSRGEVIGSRLTVRSPWLIESLTARKVVQVVAGAARDAEGIAFTFFSAVGSFTDGHFSDWNDRTLKSDSSAAAAEGPRFKCLCCTQEHDGLNTG